jgi:hypothetical protein
MNAETMYKNINYADPYSQSVELTLNNDTASAEDTINMGLIDLYVANILITAIDSDGKVMCENNSNPWDYHTVQIIDESGKESGMMSPERLGYFFELPVLEQPTADESAVVVDIPKDLMNILTGNVTNKATSSQNNPITPDQQNQEEDAASCGIK